MRKNILTITCLVAVFVANPVWAYKEQIHRVCSLKAFDRAQVDWKKRTGIQADANLGGSGPRTLVGQGAFDEDDIPNPLNHFYDPVHDAALTIRLGAGASCNPFGATAKTRATHREFSEYSTWFARSYLRLALLSPDDESKTEYLRKMFLSLGHSIHLLQDMAQPEHTRNDQHLAFLGMEFGDAKSASLWEEWGINHLLGLNPAVSYDGYPNVKLPSSGDYFATPAAAGDKGLAQFSNRNFVTQDTNYGDEAVFGKCLYYTVPAIGSAAGRTETVNEAVTNAPFSGVTIMTVKERVFTSFPTDGYLGKQETDPYHTFHSVVDLETMRLHGDPVYSLGDGSYLSRASMLIPRAVGYSAGYLEHVFRGSIDVKWNNNPDGGVNVIIKNTSSEEIGADAKIDLAYVPGKEYLNSFSDVAVIAEGAIASYLPGFAGLPAGASVTLGNLQVPQLHAGDKATQFERRTIIRATLGTEEDDLITLVQPPTTGRLRMMGSTDFATNSTLRVVQTEIDGDGTYEPVNDVAHPPNVENSPRMSRDGQLIARVVHPDLISYLDVAEISSQSTWRVAIRTPEGKPVYPRQLVWSGDSKHVAAVAELLCASWDPCSDNSGGWKTGVAVIDVFTGITDFHWISTIPEHLRFQYQGGYPTWTADGRFFDLMTDHAPALGVNGKIVRYDLLFDTVTVRPLPSLAEPLVPSLLRPTVTRDGSRFFLTAIYADGTGIGLWMYDWPTNHWTPLTGDLGGPNVVHMPVVLSPQETEIAHVRTVPNSGCEGDFQPWIYNIATGIDRPVSTRPCGGFTEGRYFLDMVWPQ